MKIKIKKWVLQLLFLREKKAYTAIQLVIGLVILVLFLIIMLFGIRYATQGNLNIIAMMQEWMRTWGR